MANGHQFSARLFKLRMDQKHYPCWEKMILPYFTHDFTWAARMISADVEHLLNPASDFLTGAERREWGNDPIRNDFHNHPIPPFPALISHS